MVARIMYRIEMNIHEKFVRQFGLFTKIVTVILTVFFLYNIQSNQDSRI